MDMRVGPMFKAIFRPSRKFFLMPSRMPGDLEQASRPSSRAVDSSLPFSGMGSGMTVTPL